VSQLSAYNNEQDIINALQNGPVAVSIFVGDDFQHYGGGIYQNNSCAQGQGNQCSTNHAVAIVGYGTDANGVNFWKVRNSWGYWGEGGYVRVLRGVNTCCIETYALSVTVQANVNANAPATCSIQTDAPAVINGRMLWKNVYSTIAAINPDQCWCACKNDANCVAFNLIGGGQCQLISSGFTFNTGGWSSSATPQQIYLKNAQSVTLQSAPADVSYPGQLNADYQGAQYQSLQVATVDQCWAACLSDAACNSIAYNSGATTCNLINSHYITGTANPAWNSYAVDSSQFQMIQQ